MDVFHGTGKTLALLVFLSVPTAWAQSQRVVVLDATAEGTAPAVLSELRRAIGAANNLELAEKGPVTRALVEPATADQHEAPMPSLTAADDAIARFDYDEALLALFRAERPLLDRRPDGAVREALAEINFKLGLVYVGQGDLERARASMRAVHFLTPKRQLDPARYPPEVIGEFERARPGPSDATVAVSSSVNQAAIFVDGRPYAVSPADVEYSAGVHYILVVAPGYRPSGRRVVSKSGSVQRLNIPLAPLPLAEQAKELRHTMRARTVATASDDEVAAEKIFEWTRADVVIILRGKSDAPTASPIRRSGPTRPSTLPVQQERLIADISPLNIPPTPSWYTRPWVLVTVGGVVAAVITVALLSSGDDTRPTGGLCFPPQC